MLLEGWWLSWGCGCLWNLGGSSLLWISSFKFNFCWNLNCITVRDIICSSPCIRIHRWNVIFLFLKPRDPHCNHQLWMKRCKYFIAISAPDNMFIAHVIDKVVLPKCQLVSVLILGAHWAGQWNFCARSLIWRWDACTELSFQEICVCKTPKRINQNTQIPIINWVRVLFKRGRASWKV